MWHSRKGPESGVAAARMFKRRFEDPHDAEAPPAPAVPAVVEVKTLPEGPSLASYSVVQSGHSGSTTLSLFSTHHSPIHPPTKTIYSPRPRHRLAPPSLLQPPPNRTNNPFPLPRRPRAKINPRPLLAPPDLDPYLRIRDVPQRNHRRRAIISPHGAVAVLTRIVDPHLEFADAV